MLKILSSCLNLTIWLIFILNFFQSKNKKEANIFLDKLTQKNLGNVFFFCVFFDLIFSKIPNRFEKIIYRNPIKALYNFSISFFLNKIIKNKILLQEIKEAVMECFFVLLFSPRQFSLYSSLVFGIFVLSKTFHQAFVQNLKIEKITKKDFSNLRLFLFFQLLIFITFIESVLAQVYISFNRRRTVNIIVGIELISLTLSIKESIIDHFFTLSNEKFFDCKWTFHGANELLLKIWISGQSLFSFISALNSLSISKKGVFKYYVLRRAFQCGKELFQNFEEYDRYRKTQVCIGSIMENPDEEDISGLSDNVCIVCRDDMLPESSKKLPCKHVLHTLCLQDWLRRQFGCPICMTPISTEMVKTAKQEEESGKLSYNKAKINIIATATGLSRNIEIKDSLQYFKNNFVSLPSLFPDFTNMFFWESYNSEENKTKKKIKNFRFLYSKNIQKFKKCTKLYVNKKYLKNTWIECRFTL
jgi:hypothetical protein